MLWPSSSGACCSRDCQRHPAILPPLYIHNVVFSVRGVFFRMECGAPVRSLVSLVLVLGALLSCCKRRRSLGDGYCKLRDVGVSNFIRAVVVVVRVVLSSPVIRRRLRLHVLF